MEKICRIHQKQQYQKVFSGGKKLVGHYMVMLFMKNGETFSRIGMITSKKVGKAHERNFARRRMRAFVRENYSGIREGYDIVLIARESIKEADYQLIVKDFQFLLKKGRMMRA